MSHFDDRMGLFARILEEPNDDAPRLIYSDILEEEGEFPRAEFIRLQIQAARLPKEAPETREISERIFALQLEHSVQWIDELPKIPGIHWEIFERGFISTARIDKPESLFAHADAIMRAAPISRLRLHRFYPQEMQQLADLPLLNQIIELDLENGCRAGNVGISALMESGRLTSLETLKIPNNNIGPSALTSIARSPHSGQLKWLDVSNNDVYDDGMLALLNMGRFTKLERLMAGSCRLTGRAIQELANTQWEPAFRLLGLSNNHLGVIGLNPLAVPNRFQQLRGLLADGCNLNDITMAPFLRSVDMPNMEWLYLRRNNLTDLSAEIFAEIDRFPKLRQLNLGDNRITRIYLRRMQERYGQIVIVD